MNRLSVLVLIAWGLSASYAHAADEAVAVGVGRVTVVRSPHVIAMVAVGDPAIADVVAEGENAVLVFGKKTGQTDLVLMDGAHHLLRKSSVVVGPAGSGDTIIVRRPGAQGVSADAWACTPVCVKVTDK